MSAAQSKDVCAARREAWRMVMADLRQLPPDLSDGECWQLLLLEGLAAEGLYDPSNEELATLAHTSVRTVERRSAALVKKEQLDVHEDYVGRSRHRKSNLFTVLPWAHLTTPVNLSGGPVRVAEQQNPDPRRSVEPAEPVDNSPPSAANDNSAESAEEIRDLLEQAFAQPDPPQLEAALAGPYGEELERVKESWGTQAQIDVALVLESRPYRRARREGVLEAFALLFGRLGKRKQPDLPGAFFHWALKRSLGVAAREGGPGLAKARPRDAPAVPRAGPCSSDFFHALNRERGFS